jgi:glycosyltransferase involved in cell wall biosynthesis
MENHIRQLTTVQRQLGCQVSLIFNQGSVEHTDDLRVLERINLRRIKSRFLMNVIFYIFVIRFVVKNKIQCDVLHVHGDWSAFLFGLLISNKLGARKRVASIHDKICSGIHKMLTGSILRKYQLIFTTGQREAKYLKQIGVSEVYFQPSGIDETFLRIGWKQRFKTQIDVICVANLVAKKNIALLIDVAEKLPQYSFEVIGSGPMQAEINNVLHLKRVNNVKVVGKLQKHQIAERLRQARVFYLPSYYEGTPTALMEAMAIGLPVVTTPSNDYTGLVFDGRNGYVLKDFSVECSVNGLIKALNDNRMCAKTEAANNSLVRAFNWISIGDKMTSLMVS